MEMADDSTLFGLDVDQCIAQRERKAQPSEAMFDCGSDDLDNASRATSCGSSASLAVSGRASMVLLGPAACIISNQQ